MSYDFEFTPEQLAHCLPQNKHPHELFDALAAVLPRYSITSVDRVAAFLAQCGHESAGFTILRENLNYSAEQLHRVWPKRFPTLESAQPYNRNPEAIANRVYCDRMGNGDEASGDGYRYRGRGAIQLTGKDNYTAFAHQISMSIDEAVAYTETLQGAIESAAFFWYRNNLNAIADNQDMMSLTKRINGGTIGLEDRKKHYAHIMEVLGGSSAPAAAPSAESDETANWPTLRQGSPHHEWVQRLQQCLGVNADGNFGPGTEHALREWQTANVLAADGVAGPNTLKRLFG